MMNDRVVYIVFLAIFSFVILILVSWGLQNPKAFLPVTVGVFIAIVAIASVPVRADIEKHSLNLAAKMLSCESKKNQYSVIVMFGLDGEARALVFEEQGVKNKLKKAYDAEFAADKKFYEEEYGEILAYEEPDLEARYQELIENSQNIKTAQINLPKESDFFYGNVIDVVYNTKNGSVTPAEVFASMQSTFAGKTKLVLQNMAANILNQKPKQDKSFFLKLTLALMFFSIAVFAGCALLSFAVNSFFAKSYSVEGHVVEIRQSVRRISRGGSNRTREVVLYSPVWEYYDMSGKKHLHESDVETNFAVPEIGAATTLHIDEKGNVFEKGDIRFYVLAGLCFLVFGSLLLILVFVGVIRM